MATDFWLIDYITEGNTAGTFQPENLEFTLRISEPSELTCEHSLGMAGISANFIGPYRTDFVLRRTNTVLFDGIVTSLSVKAGSEYFSVGGQDYLHYLQRRHYPFDPTDIETYRYVTSGAIDVTQIVRDLLINTRDFPNSYCLPYTLSTSPTGYTTKYRVELADTETIYDKILALSQLNSPQGGFEFGFTPGKVFHLWPKERFAQSAGEVIRFDKNSILPIEGGPFDELEFTNTGPLGTHAMGIGAGKTGQPIVAVKHFRANSARYRRLDNVPDFGDVRNLARVESQTSEALAFGSNPQHDIPLQVNPDVIPNFWSIVVPGCYVWVDYDLGIHRINSLQKVKEIHGRVTNQGDEYAALVLNQAYDPDPTAGLDDP